MKLFKNIMSRKPDPEEIAAMEAQVEEAAAAEQGGRKAIADDSGSKNASLGGSDDLYPGLSAKEPMPDEGSDGWGVSAWADNDDDWDDEDWGEEWDEDEDDTKSAADAKAALVDGIRDAARDIQGDARKDGIRNWSEDEEVRRDAVRSKLGSDVEEAEERILSRTNSEMTNIMSSRRRSAMAHLKKAAQATKADRVLSHVVGRDPAGDPEEQSAYRDDLAKVVKPRPTSRPVSRPVSRSPKVEAEWEGMPSDEDAGLMAEAASERRPTRDRSAFEEERKQHLPADLTEDEFTSDEVLVSQKAESEIEDDADEVDLPRGPAAWSKPIFEDDMDDDAAAVEMATRRASRVRTALVEPVEEEVEPEQATPEAEAAQDVQADWGLGGENADQMTDEDDFDDFDEDDEEQIDWTAPSLEADDATSDQDDAGIDLDAVRSGVSQMITPQQPAVEPQDTKAEGSQEAMAEEIVQVPTPAIGRAGRSAGRVKTRLLGFQATEAEPDVFDRAGQSDASGRSQFPVGWIIVVEGPGRGNAFTLKGGVMQIGRGAGQGVQLDFGDTAISRENHAAVAFDDETGKFFLGHGGKSNLVRLNGAPVLSTEELSNRDRIRIGETTLMFIGLCNEEFIWTSGEGSDDDA